MFISLCLGCRRFLSSRTIENELCILAKNPLSSLKLSGGRLVKKNFFDYVGSGFTGKSKNEVSNRILDIIEDLKTECIAGKIDNNSVCIEGCKLDKIKTQNLLFHKFSQSSNSSLKRIVQIFDKEFQNHLSPSLASLRKEKILNVSLKNDPEHKLRRLEVKSDLILQLGLGINENAGTTGTKVIHFFSKDRLKPIAIFKCSSKHVGWLTALFNVFKKTFWGQLSYLKDHPMALPHAEAAAYCFDSFFRFKLTPPTKCCKVGDVEGALQAYVKNAQEFKAVYKTFNSKKVYSQSEIEVFQMMALFDYAIGNPDRHWGNLLVDKYKMHTIDNASGFAERSPGRWGLLFLRNQYKWRHLEIAKTMFLPKTVEFVKNELTNEKVDACIRYIQQKVPGFINEKIIAQLKLRLEVIRSKANVNASPKELGAIRTGSAMELSSNSKQS